MGTLHLLVLIVINLTGVQSDSSEWGVNYIGPICAVRGSNVSIPCSYSYPPLHEVKRVRWCSMNSNKVKCDDNSPYVYDSSSNRASEEFKYTGNNQSDCTLLISNVQFSHSAEYQFRFITNVEGGRWTGVPGVTLQVGDLQLTGPPENKTLKKGESVNLTCAVNCSLSSPQFVWFKNNQRLPSSDPVLHFPALTVEDSGSYSCALKTDEAVRSEIVRIHLEGVHPSGWINGLVIVVVVGGIVVIFALIFLAVVYNKRKKEKAREERDGGKDKKTQVGESRHSEQTDPQTNQVTQSAEVLQQEHEQTYASVKKTKTGKKKKAQIETDKGSGRKTQVGNSAQSGLLQEDDVTYASVSIKPSKPEKRVITTVQLEEDDSVIYSAVATK